MSRLQRLWYTGPSLITWLIWPLSALFCLLVSLRRLFYRIGLFPSQRLPVPIVVIGNITVGGTGKTPLVIWFAHWLLEKGLRPGIVTRGYGGHSKQWPLEVTAHSATREVGDEAVLLARRTGCPVYAGPDRVAAVKQLLEEHACDLILSDDGLQHYAMQRDAEIVVIDGERRFGNGLCLPAGPLRERPDRLSEVDLVVTNGIAKSSEQEMRLTSDRVLKLDGSSGMALSELSGTEVVAVAGIGNPERFFRSLEEAGLKLIRHPFSDHHEFTQDDLAPFAGMTVLMTEKDAVKCEKFTLDNLWYVPANAALTASVNPLLERLIERLRHG